MRHPFAVLERWRGRLYADPRAVRWLVPAGIVALALALRLYGLGDKPFWLDEVASLRRATLPLSETATASLRASHYPAYFVLLWLVAKIGASQFLLRLPSALFGAINAGLAYLVGREADGPRTGIAAGLLLAFSPFDVQYGQEARPYTLAAGLILIALWGLVRLARDPVAAAVPLRWNRAPSAPWLAYCGGMAAALNTLNVAVPFLLACNLAAAAIAATAPPPARPAFLRNWGGAQAVVVALWLPSLAAVYVGSSGGVVHASSWVPSDSVHAIRSLIESVYLHRISRFITFRLMPASVPGLSLVIAGLVLWGAWRLRHRPAVLAALGSAAVVLPLAMLALSPVAPVLVPRYFGWSAAPFFILAGAGLGGIARRRFAACAAALAGVCLVNLLPYYHEETKPRWDLAARQLASQTRPGDVVLLNSYYAYYVLSAFAERSSLADHGLELTWEPDKAAQLLPNHDLWVVFGRTGQVVHTTPEDFAASLGWLGRPVVEEHIGRYIVLWRFRASAALAAGCTTACPDNPTAKP